MGVVAVLHPQDCFQKNPVPIPRVKTTRNPNSRPQPSNFNRRKRVPNNSPPSRAAAAAAKSNYKNVDVPSNNYNHLVQGQVKILKRGESLSESPPKKTEIKASDLGLNGLNPAQNKANGFYAGSAFITSPPPSSLPFPAFFAKKVVDDAEVDSTRALLKLLGLRL